MCSSNMWSREQAIADAGLEQCAPGSDEASDEAADKLQRASVDDVSGPVLQMIGRWGLGGGGRKLECRDRDLMGTEKEEGAERCSGACRGLGQDFSRDAIDHAHERAKGVVHGPACLLLFLFGERLSCGLGDFAGDDFSGVLLLERDPPGGFALGEPGLLLYGLLVRGGELLELIHDESGSDAGCNSGDDTS